MNIFKRLAGKSPRAIEQPVETVGESGFQRRAAPGDNRPLSRIAATPPLVGRITPETMANLHTAPGYADVLAYFLNYPSRSIMSDNSRAVLFSLVRAMQPKVVAEIGTLFAGTTEVLARALWENGDGMVHTTDPFGAQRCPDIIAAWPPELQQRTQYHALNSMDFFLHLGHQRLVPDLVLIDGNHDYEFALFDLLMAARLMRPGGIVVMDNAEQSGPFHAARTFLAANPGWRELGQAIPSHKRSNPFDALRGSVRDTSFIILQALPYLSIGEGPHSWGQAYIDTARLEGFALEMPQQTIAGYLHYQTIFRGFFPDGAIVEEKAIWRLRIDKGSTLIHTFQKPFQLAEGGRYTIEFDLSWEADDGSSRLALAATPRPLAEVP